MDNLFGTKGKILESVKNAVLGNAVLREYHIGPQIGSFGPALSWRIFEAKKKLNGQLMSAFLLDKKYVEQFPKSDREAVMELLKRGPQRLAKLRHPSIVRLDHPLEDSRDCLAFVTEPVLGSLANVLGKVDNLPAAVGESFRRYDLHDLEKAYGLYQLLLGVAFLHGEAHIAEGCLSPENIVVAADGCWKVSGLCFHMDSKDGISMVEIARLPGPIQPSLNYLAPEVVLDCTMNFQSDVFSFGILTYAVHSGLKTPFDAGGSITSYSRHIESIKIAAGSALRSDAQPHLPSKAVSMVESALSRLPDLRPSTADLLKSPFFDDHATSILKVLDSLVQRDDLTKVDILRSLPSGLKHLPKRVLLYKVLPCLSNELSNTKLLPFVIPSLLAVAEGCSKDEYAKNLMTIMKPLYEVLEPKQVSLLLLQKLAVIMERTSVEDIRYYVLPMICRCLNSDETDVQTLALSILPGVINLVEFSSVKTSILPRLRSIVVDTSVIGQRVSALVCIGKLMGHLDKFMIMDDIFPMLLKIPSYPPPVLVCILGILHEMLINKIGLDVDFISMQLTPYIFPLAFKPGLNVAQFDSFMKTIHEFINFAERHQKNRLFQQSKIEEEQKNIVELPKERSPSGPVDVLTASSGRSCATEADSPSPSVTTAGGHTVLTGPPSSMWLPSASTELGSGICQQNWLGGRAAVQSNSQMDYLLSRNLSAMQLGESGSAPMATAQHTQHNPSIRNPSPAVKIDLSAFDSLLMPGGARGTMSVSSEPALIPEVYRNTSGPYKPHQHAASEYSTPMASTFSHPPVSNTINPHNSTFALPGHAGNRIGGGGGSSEQLLSISSRSIPAQITPMFGGSAQVSTSWHPPTMSQTTADDLVRDFLT